jgi:hypothetical protein
MDHKAVIRKSNQQLEIIEGALEKLSCVEISRTESYETFQPLMTVIPDKVALGKTARDIVVELAQGDPAVWVAWSRSNPDQFLIVADWRRLMEGEEHIVAKKLLEVLTPDSSPSGDDTVYHPAFIAKGATSEI